MKQDKHFFDSPGDWGDILTDTYESNSNIIELANLKVEGMFSITFDRIKTIYIKDLTTQLLLTHNDIIVDYQDGGYYKRLEAYIEPTELNLLYTNEEGEDASYTHKTIKRELLFSIVKSDIGYIFLYYPLLNLETNETNYSSFKWKTQIKYMIDKDPITNLSYKKSIVNINDDVLKLITNVLHEHVGNDKEFIDNWNKLKQNIIMNNNKVIQ